MERFGPYELEEKLGEGGMAEVFRARRRGEDGFVRTVCVKRLLPHIEADESMAKAFGDEARIMAALHHPAVVSVLEYGRHAGHSFLAMELVEGTDLRRVLRRTGPLPPELAIYVGHELAAALAHAHAAHIDGVAQRVVHRDVTPSNVLLSVDGSVKLTDFGIAKATTRAQVTQHGIVKGKVPYMSPEQAIGLELDQRSDLFALGVVLYECIAGRRPYDGPSDLDTFRNVQCGVHEPLDRLVPSTPRGLVSLIHTLIRPHREDRIPSAADVVELLAGFAITLGARRALVDRVARCRAQAPAKTRRPVRAPVELEIDVEVAPPVPAPLLMPQTTRAVRARRREPLPSLTEQMSPTAIAACFGDAVRTGPSASTDVIPSTRGRHSGPRLTRVQLALLAIGWVAVSSLLGGLAARLWPERAVDAPTAVAQDGP